MAKRRASASLHALIEVALKRPMHWPKTRYPHVADEYAEMGGKHKADSCECGACIARELRRGLK